MRKKGIPERLVRALISQCEGAKTKVKVGTHLSEEFEANVGLYLGSVLAALSFAKVIDVDTNVTKVCILQEILNADDIVFIAVSIVQLQEKCHSLERCS